MTGKKGAPLVYISEHLLCTSLAVNTLKILGYPVDEMVFESALDDLMEEIR
jgi:hypothetical protein